MQNSSKNIGPEPKRIVERSLSNFHIHLLHFDAINSTNTFLKDYVHNVGQENLNPREAICALADEQTAGRGRMDRAWHSPKGEGLYFSILLKPELEPGNIPLLTLMAAIAIAETIEASCQLIHPNRLDIKWPNDILVNNRKAAGILTEASFESERLNYAVLGFGVNLNQSYFPEEIASRATSLYLQTEKVIDREEFLGELISRIDRWYGALVDAPEKIAERWRQLSSFAEGKLICVEIDGVVSRARTCGLEAGGALRAKTDDGRIITLYGGEITAYED